MSARPERMTVEGLARRDHERNCRNEPEWPDLTISHRHVHDTRALREHARLHPDPSR